MASPFRPRRWARVKPPCEPPGGVLEGIGTQRLDGGLEVKEANSHLHFHRELGGGPELLDESVRQVLVTTCIGGQHTIQKISAFLTSGFGEGTECAPCSIHSTINVSRIA